MKVKLLKKLREKYGSRYVLMREYDGSWKLYKCTRYNMVRYTRIEYEDVLNPRDYRDKKHSTKEFLTEIMLDCIRKDIYYEVIKPKYDTYGYELF